jgi:acetolactate synthase-1/2/3 large subunit
MRFNRSRGRSGRGLHGVPLWNNVAFRHNAAHPMKPTELKSVADVVAATLRNYGARFAFGIPGNDVLETVRACEEAGIRFTLAKAEPSAAFMADAVWQLTGAPSVLIPALGPGISNAISGIAGAAQERSAMIVLSGEMATKNMGIYNHQVFDHVALCRPVTKYAEHLNPQRAGQQVAKALDIATTWPAGPAMLNVAADANKAPAADVPCMPPVRVTQTLSDESRDTLTGMLSASTKPLALIGRGALMWNSPDAVSAFIHAWQIPFAATYKAKGVIDERDPLCIGAVGLSPVMDAITMRAVDEADLLVLIGFDPIELRDAWVDGWPAEKDVITLDWAPTNDRIFPRGREAYGTLPVMLGALRPADGSSIGAAAGSRGTSEWKDGATLSAVRSELTAAAKPRSPAHGISPAALFDAIDRRNRPDWVLTVDVGAHRILANHVLHCQSPGQLLQSNGLGCMGYAIPAAIGAQLVYPERTVVAMLGDGCALMTLGEIAVAAENKLPLVIVVLNDDKLSLIALKQDKMKMAARGVDFQSPDFAAIARGFGAVGVKATTLAEFEAAFESAVASRKLTVIDAVVDPAEYWEQM